jgi:hypothetical protein
MITKSDVKFVTYEQYKAHYVGNEEVLKHFDEHDTNNDGKVDVNEFATWHSGMWGGDTHTEEDHVSFELQVSGFQMQQLTRIYTSIDDCLIDSALPS